MIKVSRNDKICTWTLSAKPCNEIGLDLTKAFEKEIAALKSNLPKVLVVNSAIEGGFCAGANLRELYQEMLKKDKEVATEELRRFLDRIHKIMNTLDTLPCATIGVVHGVCFGGGFELALTLDVLVAESSARFCFPELRLGLIPGFGGIPRLNREVGNAVIRDLLLTGRSLNAKKAHDLGLVSQVVADGRGIDIAMKMAHQMQRIDAHVVARSKAFMKPLPLLELDREKQQFIEMFQSPSVIEGLKKFIENEGIRPYLA
ncbi:MAG: enoyl-CoA hydratase/isomerase family protein [Bdellovibrionales bacterium]|nr:enoyl-CoA hydratase/isomerase family protein [Bdellovibrionales bacterium]